MRIKSFYFWVVVAAITLVFVFGGRCRGAEQDQLLQNQAQDREIVFAPEHFKCEPCDKIFSNNGSLERHKNSKKHCKKVDKDNNPLIFVCPKCNRTIDNVSNNVKKHLKAHDNPQCVIRVIGFFLTDLILQGI